MHGRSTHGAQPQLAAPPAPTPGREQDARQPVPPGERTTSPGAISATVATLPHRPAGGAVVHLGPTAARVARDHPPGSPEVVTVRRRSRAQHPDPYLVRILDAVGDRAPVVIAGVADERAALELEFVRIGHRPERFIDDPALDSSDEALRGRLRALHSHPG